MSERIRGYPTFMSSKATETASPITDRFGNFVPSTSIAFGATNRQLKRGTLAHSLSKNFYGLLDIRANNLRTYTKSATKKLPISEVFQE